MNPMQQRPPVCKFGQNCNKFAQGMCKFFHPNQPGQGGKMGNPREGGGNNPNQNFGGPRNPNYQYNNYSNDNPRNFNQGGGNTGWGSQHGNYGKSFNQTGNQNPSYNNQSQSYNNPNPNYSNPNMPPKGDDFTSKFCMSYQFNQPCKFEEKGKCSRIHGFDEEGKIRRVAFSNEIPPEEPSRLGKFVRDNQTYLVLRMGKSVSFLTFNQETGEYANLQSWPFPKPELNYSYYSQKDNFIYFAAQNPKTTLHDIWIYDIFTGNLITILEAHLSHVTDVIHFSNDIVLSSSQDGTIKVWKIEGTNATLDQNSTDGLFKTYSTGKQIKILFLDLSIVNGMKVLSAGTNDNRLLFFLGDQMQYYPLPLQQSHAQTFKIRYCTINDVSVAFVITWSLDGSSSSVIAVNLNDFKVSLVTTNSAKQNPKNKIYLIEVIQEKLFVANMQGNVTIFSLPTLTKMGLMLHKNPVNSIVSAEYVTKTNIKIPQMFVLESKYFEKPGSIGVYTIKI